MEKNDGGKASQREDTAWAVVPKQEGQSESRGQRVIQFGCGKWCKVLVSDEIGQEDLGLAVENFIRHGCLSLIW